MAITTSLGSGVGLALTQIWDFLKFKGQENYHFWSKKMRSALNYCGLWDIVGFMDIFLRDFSTTEEVTAEDGTVIISTHVFTRDEVLAYQNAMKEWRSLNNQVSELIYSMCNEKLADSIEDEELVRNRWFSLEEDYMDSGFVLRFIKLQELWNIILFSSSNSIETYVVNVRIRIKDLKRMGASIDSWILVSILLNNLDGKYKDFVYRLLTTLEDVPEFDKIVIFLHEEDRLFKRDNKEFAMVAVMKRYQKE